MGTYREPNGNPLSHHPCGHSSSFDYEDAGDCRQTPELCLANDFFHGLSHLGGSCFHRNLKRVLRTCSNIALIGKSQNGGQANLKTCENRCFPETASICFKSIQVKYVDFQIPLPVARPSQ